MKNVHTYVNIYLSLTSIMPYETLSKSEKSTPGKYFSDRTLERAWVWSTTPVSGATVGYGSYN